MTQSGPEQVQHLQPVTVVLDQKKKSAS